MSHLKVAYEYGVNQAIAASGYASLVEFQKEAAIFGASPSGASSNAAIPYEERLQDHLSYLQAKAKESPSGMATPALVGGGLGLLGGGLLGALSGAPIQSSAALGGLGGAGLGALLGHLDKNEIERAQNTVDSEGGAARDLRRRIEAAAAAERRQRDLRHREIMDALDARSVRG